MRWAARDGPTGGPPRPVHCRSAPADTEFVEDRPAAAGRGGHRWRGPRQGRGVPPGDRSRNHHRDQRDHGDRTPGVVRTRAEEQLIVVRIEAGRIVIDMGMPGRRFRTGLRGRTHVHVVVMRAVRHGQTTLHQGVAEKVEDDQCDRGPQGRRSRSGRHNSPTVAAHHRRPARPRTPPPRFGTRTDTAGSADMHAIGETQVM